MLLAADNVFAFLEIFKALLFGIWNCLWRQTSVPRSNKLLVLSERNIYATDTPFPENLALCWVLNRIFLVIILGHSSLGRRTNISS